jgi:uncharacterized membrane protein YoaK (UPF0700 family)
MNRLTVHERVLASTLAALAGFVDAIAFVELGGYFVSFMSGNSTRMSVGLAQGAVSAGYAGSLIASFVLGVVAGSLLGRAAEPRRRMGVLIGVGALLALAALAGSIGQPWIAGWTMAAAMGAENAVFEERGDVRVGLTYMTGTLVKLGQRIALALAGGPRFEWAPFLLQWLSLAAGALVGASLHPLLGLSALWLAAAVAGALAMYAGAIRS